MTLDDRLARLSSERDSVQSERDSLAGRCADVAAAQHDALVAVDITTANGHGQTAAQLRDQLLQTEATLSALNAAVSQLAEERAHAELEARLQSARDIAAASKLAIESSMASVNETAARLASTVQSLRAAEDAALADAAQVSTLEVALGLREPSYFAGVRPVTTWIDANPVVAAIERWGSA